MKWSSDRARLVSAVECNLLLVSASFEEGGTWAQPLLRLWAGWSSCARYALHSVKSSLFWLSCSWQSFRTGTLERSSSYSCLLIRGGCPVCPVCLRSLFRLTFLRIRASDAVQLKGCCWVQPTKAESDVHQWAHQCYIREGDSAGKLSQFSLLHPYGRWALSFPPCQLLHYSGDGISPQKSLVFSFFLNSGITLHMVVAEQGSSSSITTSYFIQFVVLHCSCWWGQSVLSTFKTCEGHYILSLRNSKLMSVVLPVVCR